MGLFKKKIKNLDSNVEFRIFIKKYGEAPGDICIFCGMKEEEIQKKEHMWISYEALEIIRKDPKAFIKLADVLEKELETYIKKRGNGYECDTRTN